MRKARTTTKNNETDATATTTEDSAATGNNKKKKIVECAHPTVICEMCAECGADLRKLDDKNKATTTAESSSHFSMVHSVPGLRVSYDQAQKISKIDEERLLGKRKLVLLVDLDQTLVHTSNDGNVPAQLQDVFHFQLPGHGHVWYHTRLRPLTRTFLSRISPLYELHICTFGTRSYATAIAAHLDPQRDLFSDRILSRDECFSQNCKTANLKELFPRGDHMVCIIDDREDVWNFAPNLIHVKPYHFFRHTGDINAPPGLTKKENDFSGGGYEFGRDGSILMKKDGEDVFDEEEDDDGNSRMEVVIIEGDDDDNSKLEGEVIIGKEKEKVEGIIVKEGNNEAKEKDASEKEEEKIEIPSTTDTPTPTAQQEEKEKEETVQNKNKEIIKIEDPDDYLLHLEQILKQIHSAFYALYKESGEKIVPDVKNVIPYVRRKVLKSTSLVFSGLIPTETPASALPLTRPYKVALSLGAVVSERIIPPSSSSKQQRGANDSSKPSSSSSNNSDIPPTTHLVAARLGTAKVNEAKKLGIKIVNGEWLWACWERWEWCDERLFPLTKTSPSSSNNKERVARPAPRMTRTPSGRFDYNPLLSFSSDEIVSMGHEVDDILSEDSSSSSSSSGDDGNEEDVKNKNNIKENDDDSSSSSSSSSPKQPPKKKVKEVAEVDSSSSSSSSESLNQKFRRGDKLPSDIEISDNDDDEENDDEEEEWMAKELEKEFLNE